MASRTAIQRLGNNRKPGRNHRYIQLLAPISDKEFIAARARWLHEDTVRFIIHSLVGAEDSNHAVQSVVIGLDLLVADGPIFSQPILAFALEVIGTKTKGYPAPVIGTATQHAAPEPPEIGIPYRSIRLTVDIPAAETGIEFAERFLLG